MFRFNLIWITQTSSPFLIFKEYTIPMSKDSCFVSPLYFSQNREDLFSPSSKFFLNIFFFQIPDSFADRESG